MSKNKSISLKGLSVRQARLVASRWLSSCASQEDLRISEPRLFQSYICDASATSSATKARPVSDFFENPEFASPEMAKAREAVMRLLCVCIKAHFFLFRMDNLSCEPAVFWIPDLLRPDSERFGIYYPLLKTRKAVVASDADMALVSSNKLALGRFPVALTGDFSTWLNERHWEGLLREADGLRALMDSSSGGGPREHADKGSFPFGTVFDVPTEIRPRMKSAGLRWADGIQSFYLPKGYDLVPVKAYFDLLVEEWGSVKSLAPGGE